MTKKDVLKRRKVEIEKIGNNVDIFITNSRKEREKLAENIIITEKYQNHLSYTHDMIEDAAEKADSMPDQVYDALIRSTDSIMISSTTVNALADESVESLKNLQNYNTTIDATTQYVVSGATSICHISQANPTYFPNAQTITSRYTPVNELEKNTEYIKKQLPNITPDISKDFEKFVTEFKADGPDEDKYTDLIGFRTTIFHKWIFKFVKSNFSSNLTIPESIEIFVTNGMKLDPLDRPIIQNMKNLWDELSCQDDQTPNSVKLGDVTKDYNEQLFERLIAGISALLSIREDYNP